MAVLAVEVTQGVQSLGSDAVPLIEGKNTVVVVHVRSAGPNPIGNVTATLTGTAADGRALSANPLSPTITDGRTAESSIVVPVVPSLWKDDDAFKFVLPPDWLSGTVTLSFAVTGNPLAACVPADSQCASRTVTFRPGRTPTIRLVGVEWTDSTGNEHRPTREDMLAAASQVRTQWPVATVLQNIAGHYRAPVPPDDAASLVLIQAGVAASFALDCAVSAESCQDTYVLGVITGPLRPGQFNGFASGRTAVAWLDDVNTVTHELSHLAGLRHVTTKNVIPGGCEWWSVWPARSCEDEYTPQGGMLSPVVPAAVTNPATVLPRNTEDGNTPPNSSTAFDVMTYVAPRWISAFTFNALLERGLEPEVPPAAPAASGPGLPREQGGGRALFLSGHVASQDGRGSLSVIRQFVPPQPPPVPPGGSCAIHLVSGTGQVLGVFSFTPLTRHADDPHSNTSRSSCLGLRERPR